MATEVSPEILARRAYQRAYYARNREKVCAQVAARRPRGPEARARARARSKARYAAGLVKAPKVLCKCGGVKSPAAARCMSCRVSEAAPGASEKRLARERAWRAAHPGYMREYYQQHADKLRPEKRERKKARRKSIREALHKAQGGRCAYCRDRLGDSYHVDHIVPLAKGGPNRRSNLQLTCAGCNLAKSAKDPIVFAQSLGRLL